jgi:hypothetical protein
MTSALRPLTTGEVLDRTFTLYRNNFQLFAGIGAVPALILIGAMLLMIPAGALISTRAQSIPSGSLTSLNPFTIIIAAGVYGLVVFIFYLVGYSLATGATVYAVSQVHLGRPATIRDSYKQVRSYAGRIIWIVIRIFLMMIGAMLIAYVGLMAVGLGLGAFAGFLGGRSILFAIVIGLMSIAMFATVVVWTIRIYCRYAIAVPACVLEKLSSGASLNRSKFLSKGALFRVFLIILLMAVIGMALSFAFQLPGTIFGMFVGPIAGSVLQLLGSFIGSALAFPIGTIALSLVYYDQRVRKEAFDLQLMMESMGHISQPAVTAAPIG